MTVAIEELDVAPGPASPRPHLDYLNGLRALAALYVVLHHAYLTVWPVLLGKAPTGIDAALVGWLAYGHYSVSVFIVISGFCLMLPVLRNQDVIAGGSITFYRKRARRILPPYYFGM